MPTHLLLRALRIVPLYLLGVLLVLGVAQLFSGTQRVVAATLPEPLEALGSPQPLESPVQLTILIGTLPLPVLVPVKID